MIAELVLEVVEEEKAKETDNFGLFEVDWDDMEIDSDQVADDVHGIEVEATDCQVPTCSTKSPSRTELKRKMADMEQEEHEEGLATDDVYRKYVQDHKNPNTAKKTASVRIKT